MSVYQLKDGRWVCGYPKGRDPERPKSTVKYFGRGPEALRQAEAFNLKLGLGPKNRNVIRERRSFIELVNAYMLSKEHSMAASSFDVLRIRMEGVILPILGREAADNINGNMLDRYISIRAKTVKMTTVHRELTSIRAVMNWAFRRRLISVNPMIGFDFPRKDDARINPPTRKEIEAILTCAVPHLQRAILISYHTGLRPGKEELLRLTWDDVDMIGRTLMVTSSLKGGLPRRMVPLNKTIISHLQAWYKEDRKPEMRYLIHYHGGPVDSLKTSWKKAKTRAGITRRLRMYDIRHAFATTLLERGADLKSVSEILGHASTDMTTRVYQHVSDDLKRRAVDLLE